MWLWFFKFNDDGYIVLEDFISKEKCQELIKACDDITANYTLEDIKKIPVFDASNVDDQAQARDEYFLTSVDKIRPFLEDKAGEIIKNTKEGEPVSKKIYNKIGHALHVFNPAFRDVTFADNVKVKLVKIRFILESFNLLT